MQEYIQRPTTQRLKVKCGNFDYEEFVRKIIEHFHLFVGHEVDDRKRTFIVAGKTQTGKLAVKGVVQSLCGILKIPLIIVTKGVSESLHLHGKLKEFALGTSFDHCGVVCCALAKGVSTDENIREIRQATEGKRNGGTLVVADTHNQIEKAIKAVDEYRKGKEGLKFVLAVDECDSFFRTKDKSQRCNRFLKS